MRHAREAERAGGALQLSDSVAALVIARTRLQTEPPAADAAFMGEHGGVGRAQVHVEAGHGAALLRAHLARGLVPPGEAALPARPSFPRPLPCLARRKSLLLRSLGLLLRVLSLTGASRGVNHILLLHLHLSSAPY